MIWILLAAIGIPIWLVVGALVAAVASRRSFKRRGGVFPAKLRTVLGDATEPPTSWPRRPVYARWVHDVLLIQKGLALVRTEALPVARMTHPVSPGRSDEIRKLGEMPVVMTLELDDGSSVELAASSDDRQIMVGPFGAPSAEPE